MIQMIGEGSVGPEFTTMFTTFIHNKLDKMLDPKQILTHDNESYIIGELRNTVGRDDNYRPDIASTLATRIINYSIFYAEKNTINQKIIDRIIKIVTDEEAFTNDLRYHLVKKILNGNKQKFQKLLANQQVIEMSMK